MNLKHKINGRSMFDWFNTQPITLVNYNTFENRVLDGWDPAKACATPNRCQIWNRGIERTPEDEKALKRLKSLKKGERIVYARKTADEIRPPCVVYDAIRLDKEGKIFAFMKVTQTYKDKDGNPFYQDVDYIAIGR